MSRRLTLALLGALALAPAGNALASNNTQTGISTQASASPQTGASVQTGSSTENENPINDQGSNYNYRSYITAVKPKVAGLSIEVLEFADRLILTNHTGKTVTVYGYSGEPYARVQPNGTTEQNVRSPAFFLNTNFYGNVTVPPSASASDPPKWVVLDRTGQFEWHDHRIHWMSPVTPPQVKDKGKRTKIFDWSVPISVGTQRSLVEGELYWVPESSKAPIAAIVALVAILVLALIFVLVVRRHREGLSPTGPREGSDGASEHRPEESDGGSKRREAW